MSIASFETHPDAWRHWRLSIEGPVARLAMDVQEEEDAPYLLKLNSYDLFVDIELADAINRLRWEHPEVRALVITSAKDRIFCAGANIPMLASSPHAFKVNFCKYTNETRLGLEDASATSGLKSLCAVNGTASGGGYELALACDEIILVDDRSSAVSLPEVPLLGVLPGTGGLTRVVDKRKVRRDLADCFSSMAEGVRGKRAVDWGLVDASVKLSQFDAAVKTRALALATSPQRTGPAVEWKALKVQANPDGSRHYPHLDLAVDREARRATITLKAPAEVGPTDVESLRALGTDWWPLAVFRAFEDALLHLRFNELGVGCLSLRTAGDPKVVLGLDALLAQHAGEHLVHETRHYIRRVLKRLDVTAKTLVALLDAGSCFAGTLLEIALAADRSFMLNEADVALAVGPANGGWYPMGNGLTRLQTRFLGNPPRVLEILERSGELLATEDALDLGLVTFAPDDIDWEDEVRVALEERASLSPDALTGMEANLRFAGPETLETKIFGRLSAWQNWIFQRPNAVGPRGALKAFGQPTAASFEWERT